MSRRGDCPTPRQIKQVLLGQAPAEQADALEAHLDGCPDCQQVLDKLDINNPITDAVKERHAGGGPAEAQAPDLRELVDRLEQLGSRWSLTTGGPRDGSGEPDEAPTLAPAQAADELGRLGRYRVLEVLGAGGMGLVYRAEDPSLQRLVALKVMRLRYARRPEARRRFLHEARAMAAIKHDHIATVFEVGEATIPGADAVEPVPFLAMELLEGESLADRLRHGKLPPAWVARLGHQAAAGLAAAHARGLVHRDVKPGNLWLEAPPGWADDPVADRPSLAAVGRLKLLDFGLAAPIDDGRGEGGPIPLTGREVMGTPAYMAPEQVRGDPLDGRCDLFALGCVLYEMAAGEPPFRRTPDQLRARVPDPTPPRPLTEVNPAVPPALAALIARLLAPNPADRPASARSVGQELTAIERQAETPTRRRPWKGIAATAALGLAVGAAVVWWPRPEPRGDAVIPPPTEPAPAGDAFPTGPADDAWCGFVAGLPPDRQARAVLAKLRDLNPGFDGGYERLNVGDGRVIELRIFSDHVTDLGPVRALTKLSSLGCMGSKPDSGRLTDLSPLKDLRLEWLFVNRNPDLADLGPLRDMALVQFEAIGTRVADLGPLDGTRLVSLSISRTAVRDLSTIRRLPLLRTLSITGSPVVDTEPLAGSIIHTLSLSYDAKRDGPVLRRMPTLKTVNGLSVAEFWRTQATRVPGGTKP